MRAAVEISMYPLTGDYRPPIQAFIDRLNAHLGLSVRTNALATQVWGPLDQIMALLTQEMTRSAAGGPQLVFVMKVLPGLAEPDPAPDSAPAAGAPRAAAPPATAPPAGAPRATAPP
jgi:uncharacterized protein YqgV (UPF0045/DUF77 family)